METVGAGHLRSGPEDPGGGAVSSRPLIETHHHVPVLGSTSDEARRLLLEARCELPLLVTTDHQTGGRGRDGRTWWSGPGSLAMTLALDPKAHGLRDEHLPRVALATAVAVIEALERFVPSGRLGIRWPNDIETDEGKLGGILPERLRTPSGERLAIGIGLNMGVSLEAAPEAVRRMASMLETFHQGPLERELVRDEILVRLGSVLDLLARDEPGLALRWQALDRLAGEPVRVELGNHILEGTARGITETGGLEVWAGGLPTILHGGRILRP